MRRTQVAGLAGLALLAACGNTDLQERTELLEYRVLAIRADIPEPSPDQSVTLTAIEHDPHDVDPTAPTGASFYVWETCAFSVGSLAQYDCLDPLASQQVDPGTPPSPEQAELAARVLAVLTEYGITPDEAQAIFQPAIVQTEGPELVLDMATVGGVGVRALYDLCAALTEDGLCRTIDGTPFTLEEGWNLYVKLYSGLEGVVRNDTVKLLKVRDFDERNQNNPAFAGLEATDGEGRVTTSGKPEQKLTLTLAMVAGSAEEYEAIQYGTDGKPLRDADGAFITETTTEELLYSWFATGGDLLRSRTVSDEQFDQLENTLTLPEEPGPVRVWVVARDGRGGFAVRQLDLVVEE